MKKLKIILQSKVFYIVFFLFIIIEILFTTILIKYDSIYQNGNISLEGTIIKYSIKDDKISLIIKSKEKISVTYYLKENEKIDLKIGYKISIDGVIEDATNNTIKNTFNYKKYLYNNKIYKVLKASNIKIIDTKINVFQKIKNKIYERSSMNKYISLFIVGDKTLLESDLYDSFKNVGAAHLLAISGMHVSVFILLLKKILFFLSNHKQNLFISLFLLFYAYIVNFTASILRVVISFVLGSINKRIEFNLDSLKILFLTFFMMVLVNPFYIYNIGFEYSFITSFGIIYSKKHLNKNYILNILIITFIALLFTLPITINLNYEINLLTFLSNLLLIPFITFILYPLSLITFLFPFILCIYSFLTNIMEHIILFIDSINLFVIILPKMNYIIIILYYMFLLLFIYYGFKRYFILLLSILLLNKIIPILDNNYYVSFMDVKQGDSSLIITPHKKKIIMIDTGGLTGSNYKVSDNVILYLKSLGISKIDYLILTHGDYDHMGEASNILKKIRVKNVIFNCGNLNNLEKELINDLNKKDINYNLCLNNINVNDINFEFLKTKEYDNENDNSIVIYTKINNYKFLLMGDASNRVETNILLKYPIKNIDVLKVGHHGSKTSSSKSFIDTMAPKYSVISVGKNNRFKHPNKEVLDTLDNSKVYRTDQDGSIMFKIKNNKLSIETCSP